MTVIVILALVALFIGLRLYSVLGERTGHGLRHGSGFHLCPADVRGGIPRLDDQRPWPHRKVGRLSHNLSNDPLVNSRQLLDILDGRALADLVHRRIGQAEIDHRA